MKRKHSMSASMGAVVLAASLASCSGSASEPDSESEPQDGPVNLELWVAGDCKDDGTCPTRSLVDAFEAENPDITIEIVGQPTDSYFTNLQSSSVTGRGPDIAIVFGGSYLSQIAQYTADAKQWVDPADLESSVGAQFFAEDSSIENKQHAVPTDSQWYVGFYNKKLLAEAGYDSPPQTWEELYDAAAALEANGVLPIVEGTHDTNSAQFQPLFEWAYLAAGLPLSDWNGLYDGTMEYNNPVLQSQLDKWHGLYAEGYVNDDAFNNPSTLEQFEAGEAGMTLGGGSWLIPRLEESMGSDVVGVFAPPFSDDPQDAIVQFAGSGYAAMEYSENLDAAGAFLAFVLSDAGQDIIAESGVPGTRPGSAPEGSELFNEMVELSTQDGTETYPMFDNLSQPPVTDVIYRTTAQVLVGQVPSTEALEAMDAAVAALPEEEKELDYNLGSE